MAMLLHGKWQQTDVANEEIKSGNFIREETSFRETKLIPEMDRYQLIVSYGCPWASRTLIFRELKELQNIIPVTVVKPSIADNGWEFYDHETFTSYNYKYLHQLYTHSINDYTGKVSVPVLWDKKEARIVNNESSEIIRLFNTAFNELTNNNLDLYPIEHRAVIDDWNNIIYANVNNGVYKAGFAKTQESYVNEVKNLFTTLDNIELRLKNNRYLIGELLTEADWRLFVTLVRFEAAYYGIFKCNLKPLKEYHNLYNYLLELYQWPNIKNTVNLEHIKSTYYTIAHLNPNKIIPLGPIINYEEQHDRARLKSIGISKLQ